MGEVGEQKVPSLAEQWSVPQNVEVERPIQNEAPVVDKEEKIQETIMEKADETSAADKADETTAEDHAEKSPVVEKADETLVEETPNAGEIDGASSEEKTDENPSADETETTEENSEEDEVTEEKPAIKIETAPADFRFPTTNQTRHCFTRYIEYHRCIQAKGEDAQECNKFAKYYRSLCPTEWVERWNEQRENGTFPGPL